AGGGSGEAYDLDDYDFMDQPYKQLFVWDPDAEEIIGGYRFIHGSQVFLKEDGQPNLVTSEMYHFSPQFIKEYLPYTIELGRSFVQPDYQSSKMGAKSLFALDNLWDGIGALIVSVPDTKYFFGKVTVYPHYNAQARDLVFGFITKFFPDVDKLVYPIDPFHIALSEEQINHVFVNNDYDEDYKILKKEVKDLGTSIPPLVNAYMSLSPAMRSFGFAVYHDFGNLIEVCIMIPIEEMYDEKKKRHVESFFKELE
ncbi:MAG TPA: GNAT family N-acetyltransferase, partial [Paludibacteraceae bacterium]|nr:GNAT family N-acetyltransferase [Paludibacteraceae bacterium]